MNNFLKIKLKSGALQFAIFTGAIVALLLFGLILYLHTFKTFEQNTFLTIDSIKATNNAFIKASQTKEISLDTILLDEKEGDFQSTKSISDFWGIFQKTKVISKNRNKQFQKIGLLGGENREQERLSLYLKNTFKPLVVVGNTKIEGKVKLPDQGIRPGNIAGNSYYGNQLVYGSIGQSNTSLPKLNGTFLSYLKNLDKPFHTLTNENYFELSMANKNSFFEPTKWLRKNGVLTVKEEFIGNFIIKSDTLIRITRQAILKDVLVIAPNVIIEDGVKGTFQVIATNTITVGKNVQLEYPSSLMIIDKEVDNPKNKLFVDEKSTIKGVVGFLYESSKIINNFSTQVYISKDVVIFGEVYCDGNLELFGKIKGSVFTHQFVTNASGTVFMNHLLDASISSKSFPEYFGGILFSDKSKSIVKWLY